jgi:hypothetical protein
MDKENVSLSVWGAFQTYKKINKWYLVIYQGTKFSKLQQSKGFTLLNLGLML